MTPIGTEREILHNTISIDTMWYIVTGLGSLIALLLTIIAFFLKNLISQFRETRDAVIELSANFTNQDKKCSLSHSVIDIRLNEHSKMINRHESEIEVLKATK